MQFQYQYPVEFYELRIRISSRKQIFKQKHLAYLSGAQMGLIHEKKLRSKISVHCLFKGC